MSTNLELSHLGWSPLFQQQLSLSEWESSLPARVSSVHREHLSLLSSQGQHNLKFHHSMPNITVGDWVLLTDEGKFQRRLERSSLISRKAAGSKVDEQMIAANVDSVFIVCSLNDDFNLNRIERYLALVKEVGAQPVVVLTKADCCDDPWRYVEQVKALDKWLMVEAVNGLDRASVNALSPLCQQGKTIVILGSSGVGKSTLVNSLLGKTAAETGAIRDADSKGRHTTTARSMHFLSDGGILLDTPGMRELQIADCEDGIKQTFSDISELASQCQFSDCQHQAEPHCAVQAAVALGELTQRRLDNYFKLLREQALNGATLAQRRSHDRSLSRLYRTVQSQARQRKQGE